MSDFLASRERGPGRTVGRGTATGPRQQEVPLDLEGRGRARLGQGFGCCVPGACEQSGREKQVMLGAGSWGSREGTGVADQGRLETEAGHSSCSRPSCSLEPCRLHRGGGGLPACP